MDLVAVGSQATGFFLWPLLHPEKQMNNLAIPISVFCISCGYWENYTTKNTFFGKLYLKIKIIISMNFFEVDVSANLFFNF